MIFFSVGKKHIPTGLEIWEASPTVYFENDIFHRETKAVFYGFKFIRNTALFLRIND